LLALQRWVMCDARCKHSFWSCFLYVLYRTSWSCGQNLRDGDETLTLQDRDETETLSKKSRRDRDLNVPRPRREVRLLKPGMWKWKLESEAMEAEAL